MLTEIVPALSAAAQRLQHADDLLNFLKALLVAERLVPDNVPDFFKGPVAGRIHQLCGGISQVWEGHPDGLVLRSSFSISTYKSIIITSLKII